MLKRSILAVLLTVAVPFGLSGDLASAEPYIAYKTGPPDGGAPGGHSGRDSAEARKKKEEAREKVKVLRIYQLTEVLQLDAEVANVFFSRLAAFDEASEAMHDERRKSSRLLRELLEKEASGEAVSDEALKEGYRASLVAHKKDLELEEAFIEELETMLTPLQIAKYVKFQRDFEHRLRRAIRASQRGQGVDEALMEFHKPSKPPQK